eukprot:1373269-Pyramimonas_sp.AAC.1
MSPGTPPLSPRPDPLRNPEQQNRTREGLASAATTPPSSAVPSARPAATLSATTTPTTATP